jgi:hypothetical protein
MLFKIDVADGENSPMALTRVFDLLSEPRIVRRVYATDPAGQDLWCEVTGWSEGGRCPARAALAEDSGDGVILLVYGGDAGIRLKPIGCPEEWDLASPSQWGEPCLMLDRSTPLEG